ncbi:MAG: DUF4440 domain-containing protein [Gemmatimonadales bacterium]
MRALTPVALLAALAPLPLRAQAAHGTTEAIDAAVWRPVTAAVAADDIATLGRVYHPDAVLVTSDGTLPIADAIVGWGRDMEEAKRMGTRATVSLRFGRRQDDARTAFESGVFAYATTAASGERTVRYTRFEALLVLQGGRWLILMERQLEPVDERVWRSLEH